MGTDSVFPHCKAKLDDPVHRKYHTMETIGVWYYNFTHFEPCYYVKMIDQRHVLRWTLNRRLGGSHSDSGAKRNI